MTLIAAAAISILHLGPKIDAIDQFVEKEMATRNIPGLVVIVAKDGRIVKEAAYGFSNDEKKTAMKLDDRLDMGSIGKTFTATLILQLVQEGKLNLEDPLSKYLSGIPDAWRSINIRHLLSHQSGIPDYAFETGLGLADDSTIELWKKVMFAKPLDFETGLMFQYSNSNYVLLGMVLETITKKKYVDLLADRICKRAGVPAFVFRIPKVGAKDVVTGYFFDQGKLVEAGRGGSTEMPSDGGGFCRTRDLLALIEAFESEKLVSKGLLTLMQTPATTKSGRKTGYGLGWFVRNIDKNKQISHGGNSVGFSASMSTFPRLNLSVVLMGNLYPFSGDELALRIARIVDPELQPKPIASANSDPNPARTAKLKDALSALASAKIDSELFHPEMRARLATARGRMALGAFASFKELQSLQYIDSRIEAPDTVIRYRARSDTGKWLLEFTVADDGTIYSIGRVEDPGEPG